MLSLAITAAAALTAVGDDVDQTCSSIRAGIKGFSQHAFFETEARDPEWDDPQPLIAAPAPGIEARMASGLSRMRAGSRACWQPWSCPRKQARRGRARRRAGSSRSAAAERRPICEARHRICEMCRSS